MSNFEEFMTRNETPDISRFDRPLSPEPTTTQLRIEALRAATALMNHEPWWRQPTFGGEKVSRPRGMILVAEKIVKWLQTGGHP